MPIGSSPPEPITLKTANNIYLTSSLFYERWVLLKPEDRGNYLAFTLTTPRPGLIDAHRTFVELGDETGSTWTKRFLDGQKDHWDKLMKQSWFRDYIENWRVEIRENLDSESFKAIRDMAKDTEIPAAVRFAAHKYIRESLRTRHGRGRPSNSEVAGYIKQEAAKVSTEDEDFKRMQTIGDSSQTESPS